AATPSRLSGATAMVMATLTSARITLARNQSKIAHFKAAILKLIRKSDLASVGHGLELPAFFPWFLFVPWDWRSAMIVGLADEGCFVLCCAWSECDHACAGQDRKDDGSELRDLCQHRSH